MLIIAGQLGERPSPKNMTPTPINTPGNSYIADPASGVLLYEKHTNEGCSSVHYNTRILMHNGLQHIIMSAGVIETTLI